MKVLIVIASVLAAAQAFGAWNAGLSVRFGLNPFGFGSSYFVSIPRTVAQAKNARWVQTPAPAGPLASRLVLYCPSQNDRTVCAFFDDTNNVAGLQAALPVDEHQDGVLDWEIQGFTRWTPPPNSAGVAKTYYTQQQYFVNEETLAKSFEERMKTRNNPRTVLTEGAVWVPGINGEIMRISNVADDIADTASSGFTKQACVVLMGRHYYYNMTATTPCTSEGLLPWFPLVHSGELIGLGMVTFGKLSESALVKDYFERPDRAAVEMIVPDGPACLYELADNPGLVTMHTYYIDTPWLITCLGQ